MQVFRQTTMSANDTICNCQSNIKYAERPSKDVPRICVSMIQYAVCAYH